MSEQSVSARLKSVSIRITNLLAGSWAVFGFYLLARCLLITRVWIVCSVVPVPLLVAWAALERKRWGRLALLGISRATICLLGIGLGLAVCLSREGHTPGHYALLVLRLYTRNPATSVVILLLGLATWAWMCRTHVVNEFERNKRAVLAVGQRAIAGALVLSWGALMMFAPLAAGKSLDRIPAQFGNLSDYQSRLSSLPIRAAHLPNN